MDHGPSATSDLRHGVGARDRSWDGRRCFQLRWLVASGWRSPWVLFLYVAFWCWGSCCRSQHHRLDRTNRILNATFEQSLAGIVIADAPSGTIRFINSTALELSDRLAAGSSNEIVDEADDAERGAYLLRAIDQQLSRAVEGYGSTGNEEFQIWFPDGTSRSFLTYASPVRVDQGRIIAGVVVFSDITELKEIEREVVRARDQYQSLVDNIPGTTYRCRLDENWTMLYMNDAVDPLTGYPASDFINNAVRTYSSVIHADDTVEVAEAVGRAIDERKAWNIEYRTLHADGTDRWVQEKRRAVFDDQGEVLYLDGFILDITGQKKAQLELARERSGSRSKLRSLRSMRNERTRPIRRRGSFSPT